MFPKKITEAMKAKIREVGAARALAKDLAFESRRISRGLPTSKQLAQEAGICVRRVQELMADARKTAKSVVSRGEFEAE